MNAQQIVHIVKEGEWIWKIARQYKVDPQAIIEANKLANPNDVKPGQRLIIPGGAPPIPQVTHTVKEGEGLWQIARKYNADPQAIIAANKLSEPYTLRQGQPLIIPGNAPATPQVVHVVVANDTLYSIAKHYGKTVAEIAKANNVPASNVIHIGQKLIIPA